MSQLTDHREEGTLAARYLLPTAVFEELVHTAPGHWWGPKLEQLRVSCRCESTTGRDHDVGMWPHLPPSCPDLQ